MTYQDGYEDAIKYVAELIEDLLYEFDGETFVEAESVRNLLNEIYKVKPN